MRKRNRPKFNPNHQGQQQPRTYVGVGLILGVMKHSVGSVPAELRWSWSVPKALRVPK